MNKTVKNLINKAIENEFYRITEGDTELKEFEDYKELDSCSEVIFNNMIETIPEQYHDLINEFIESLILLSETSSKFAFKQGVIAALTNLKYLEEIGQQIVLI